MRNNFLFLAIGLMGYGFKRYNDYDLDSYFKLAECAQSGLSLYGDPPLSLYPPAGGYLLELLQFVPRTATHLIWYVFSIFLFFRMSGIVFSFFPVPKKEWKQKVFYWLSWIAILQGLGAQLEGGNINLLLMYIMLEGLGLMAKSPSDRKRVSIGLFLCWFPVMFKPYLGLVSSGLTLFCFRRFSWRVITAPLLVGFLMTGLPALVKGPKSVITDYRNWLSGDVSYVDCAFTLKCNAVNYGLPSYFYQIHHWPLKTVSIFILLVSIVALIYASREKNLLRLSAALSLITFCISPASFPYTLMLLWLTVVSSSYLVLFNRDPKSRWAVFSAGIFLAAMIFLNPTYLGRVLFNEVIVYYRVTTFFVLLGLGTLTAAE